MDLKEIKKIQIFDGSSLVFVRNCDNIEYNITNKEVLNLYLGMGEDEITYSRCIEHDNNRIKITSLLNESNESTTTWVESRTDIKEDFELWDNDTWVLNTLAKLVNNQKNQEECDDTEDILQEDYHLIRGMLDKAKELGFFKYLDK